MEKKISEIKAELKNLSDDNLSCFIGEYEKDERAGVCAIVETARKRMSKLEAEKQRIEGLKKYEK